MKDPLPHPPIHPPAYHPQDSVWIGAGSFVSAFILAPHKVRVAERAHAGISKGAGRPPPPPTSPQRDNAGRRISHRPSHPWLYSATTECFRSCLTGSKAAIVLSSLMYVCVYVCVPEVFGRTFRNLVQPNSHFCGPFLNETNVYIWFRLNICVWNRYFVGKRER